MTKRSVLLKIISILFIIMGIGTLIGTTVTTFLLGGSLMTLIGGTMSAGTIVGSIGTLMTYATSILVLIAGIKGLKSKTLAPCKKLGIIIFIVALINLVLNVIPVTTFSILSVAYIAVSGLLLPILYLVGVKGSQD